MKPTPMFWLLVLMVTLFFASVAYLQAFGPEYWPGDEVMPHQWETCAAACQ